MRFLCLAGTVLLMGCARIPSSHEMAQRIAEAQKEGELPAVQASVTEGGRPVLGYVQGVRALGHPELVTPQDPWHIGSCTKPMTALLVGQLVDEGKLQWRTPLKELVPPDVKLAAGVSEVTVEQLLSHSSGMADVLSQPGPAKLWDKLFTDQPAPRILRDQLMRALLSTKMHADPGERFEYNNGGYVILGWIVEQLRGEAWEKVMQDRLFTPLAMNSCGFGPPGIADVSKPLAPWGHVSEEGKLKALPPGPKADNPPALGPAGTVHCGVDDWHKFARLFIGKGAVKVGLLTQASYDKLLTPSAHGPVTHNSLGLRQQSWARGTVFAMAGSNTFNYAVLMIAPSLNRVYTVTTNSGTDKAEKATTKILKLLIEAD